MNQGGIIFLYKVYAICAQQWQSVVHKFSSNPLHQFLDGIGAVEAAPISSGSGTKGGGLLGAQPQ